MDVPHNQVFAPTGLQELFALWERNPSATLYAGGTELLRSQGGRKLNLPANLVSLGRIEELRRITRTERYLELGAQVTLEEILGLGKIVPECLAKTLKGTASPPVRNLATIGGSLCTIRGRMDCFAAMVALDARFEIRTGSLSRWVAASRFAPDLGPALLEPLELLTRVRIPLELWDYTAHRKFGIPHLPDPEGGTAVFIARTQKNILSEIRLVFSGRQLIRNRDMDTSIAGKTLPLARRDAHVFTDKWRAILGGEACPNNLLRDQLINFIDDAVTKLVE
jgi:CO/xanthine dehydrogenase FAD-binding subunit